MSDSSPAPQHDQAIDAINEQLAQLDRDIDASTRRLEVDNAIRERLLELRATICRKPRARKPRAETVVVDNAAAGFALVEPASAWTGFNAPPVAEAA